MRFFEIITEQPVAAMTAPKKPAGPVKKVATPAPVSSTKAIHPADATTTAEPKQTTPVYADSKQIKDLIQQLRPIYPENGDVLLKNEPAGGTKQIRHLRITDVSGAEVRKSLESIGAVVQTTPLTPAQTSTSTGKVRMGFLKDGITYTVVLGSSRKGTSESGLIIQKKKSSPTKLGLAGQTFNRDQLINSSVNAVKTHFKNSLPIQEMLLGLIDIAKNGGKGSLPPEAQTVLQDNYKNVSQDFGEILAPILMMKGSDVCDFPASGNEPLTDVNVNGKKYSIKSLSGSGTSFKSISKLMDKYESSINADEERKKLYAPLAEFNPKKGGNNLDKIIRASNVARTPEFVEITRILGVKGLTSWNELTQALVKKISKMDYATFLKTFKSASTAGKWPTRGGGVQMLGFPADAAYTLGLRDTKGGKEDGAAGAPSYAADKISAAGNILVYVMGKGLEFYVQKVEGVSKQYKQMMTDIVNKSDASLGHITVNSDGSMYVDVQPFSALEFAFQYHAPSHIAGNNLPGFAIIR